MSTARERATAKAARLAGRNASTPAEEATATPVMPATATSTGQDRPVATRAPALRSKPVRVTLDLAPEVNADLERWCSAAALELGRGRVTKVDVLRVLVRELLAEQDLAATVRDQIRRDG